MNTFSALFEQLDNAGLRWAVLRNYERLPDREVGDGQLTDLDLVVHNDDLPRFRAILIDVARECGWEALTECDHYSQSPVAHHRIQVFRFYRAEPFDFLQIDVFHAFVVLGLPLLDEAQLLEGRRLDAPRGLYRIDPLKENVYRLIQIEAVLHSRRNAAKRQRYARRLKACCWQRPAEVSAALTRYFSLFAAAAAGALCRDDPRGFSWNMRLARLHFLLRAAARSPLRTISFLRARRAENRLRFETRTCGTELRAWVPGEAEHWILSDVLDLFVKRNALDEWAELPPDAPPLSAHHRGVLEQGGLLVRWTAEDRADLRIPRGANRDRVARELMAFLVRRHALLYGGAAVPGPVEAALV